MVRYHCGHTHARSHVAHARTHIGSTTLRLYRIYPLLSLVSCSPQHSTAQRSGHLHRAPPVQSQAPATRRVVDRLSPTRSRSSNVARHASLLHASLLDERLLVGESPATTRLVAQVPATAPAVRGEDSRCTTRAVPSVSVARLLAARCAARLNGVPAQGESPAPRWSKASTCTQRR